MKRTQRRKERRNLAVGFVLTILSLFIVIYLPAYVDAWQHFSGIIAIVLLLLAALSPVGKMIVGDSTKKLPWLQCERQIIFSYFVILFFILSLLLLFTTSVGKETPTTLAPIITQNILSGEYSWMGYPWLLYAFGVLLVGVMGFQHHRPKMSGALMSLFPARYLSNFTISIVDFMAILGFYIGMLAIVGLLILQLAKLIGTTLGFSIDYTVTLNILGVSFSLMYFPFSQLWKKSAQWLQNTWISPGGALLVLMVGLSLFLLFMYGAMHLFLQAFSEYYAKVNASLVSFDITQQVQSLSLTQIIWGFSMVSTAVMAGWWSHLVQGYTLRQALFLLLTPLAILVGIYTLISYSGWLSSATLETSILWLWSAPQSYIFALVAGGLLVAGFWRETYFMKGLFWVLPNLTGRKLGRIRKTIIWGSAFITYSMMVSLLGGIFFVKTVLLSFAVMFSFVLLLEVLSVGKFVGINIKKFN